MFQAFKTTLNYKAQIKLKNIFGTFIHRILFFLLLFLRYIYNVKQQNLLLLLYRKTLLNFDEV